VRREKAGSWGTSLEVDRSEGDGRAGRAVLAIATEFEPRVEELSVAYHNQMMDLLVILENSAAECVAPPPSRPAFLRAKRRILPGCRLLSRVCYACG
jgi:hypothetical protein